MDALPHHSAGSNLSAQPQLAACCLVHRVPTQAAVKTEREREAALNPGRIAIYARRRLSHPASPRRRRLPQPCRPAMSSSPAASSSLARRARRRTDEPDTATPELAVAGTEATRKRKTPEPVTPRSDSVSVASMLPGSAQAEAGASDSGMQVWARWSKQLRLMGDMHAAAFHTRAAYGDTPEYHQLVQWILKNLEIHTALIGLLMEREDAHHQFFDEFKRLVAGRPEYFANLRELTAAAGRALTAVARNNQELQQFQDPSARCEVEERRAARVDSELMEEFRKAQSEHAVRDAHAADVRQLREELQKAAAKVNRLRKANAAKENRLREELRTANAEASRLAEELQKAQSEHAAEMRAVRFQHQSELITLEHQRDVAVSERYVTGLRHMRRLAVARYPDVVDPLELKPDLLPPDDGDDCYGGPAAV